MDLWGCFCQRPAEGFANRLTGKPVSPPRRWALLAWLLLISLLPRLWAAWDWNILWADTVAYLEMAQALDEGNPDHAFGSLGLNIFPVLLLWLRKLPCNVTLSGEWWSVAAATLTVLPLFGWIRRQFDDQVAVVACVLYAFHPKLLAFSPLIIRDPTFWFLFSLSVYLSWRAVAEIRWWLFLSAGLVVTLAVHTRTEGWLLLAPLLLWTAFRMSAAEGSRVRLAAGTALCIALIPLSVTFVNLTWLREYPQWKMVHVGQEVAPAHWLRSFVADPPTEHSRQCADESLSARRRALARQDSAPLIPVPVQPSGLHLIRKLVVRAVKAYTYVYVLLTLAGLTTWRRVSLRSDHLVSLLTCLLLCGAIYIHYTHARIDIRYFLPMVLLLLPWTALGLFSAAELLIRLTRRCIVWTANRRGSLVVGLLIAAVLAGLPDMRPSARRFMHEQADMGKWIEQQYGPRQRIGGNLYNMRLVAHYAQGDAVSYLAQAVVDGESPMLRIVAQQPRVVLLWEDYATRIDWAPFVKALVQRAELGYRRVPPDQLPPNCRDIIVLVCPEE